MMAGGQAINITPCIIDKLEKKEYHTLNEMDIKQPNY